MADLALFSLQSDRTIYVNLVSRGFTKIKTENCLIDIKIGGPTSFWIIVSRHFVPSIPQWIWQQRNDCICKQLQNKWWSCKMNYVHVKWKLHISRTECHSNRQNHVWMLPVLLIVVVASVQNSFEYIISFAFIDSKSKATFIVLLSLFYSSVKHQTVCGFFSRAFFFSSFRCDAKWKWFQLNSMRANHKYE